MAPQEQQARRLKNLNQIEACLLDEIEVCEKLTKR